MAAQIDISEARQDFHKLDEKVSMERVLYVMRHQRKAFAIVDIEYMESMLETIDLLGDPDGAMLLEQGLEDLRAGRVVPHDTVEQEFNA